MFSDFKEGYKTHLLRYFPERQIYLRTESDVKYFHLSTKAQASVAVALSLVALWCVLTIGNVIWGYNPFSSSVRDLRVQEANFERAMAEERARLQNTQLMLAQQQESFEKIARSFEEKHAAIAKIVGTEDNALGLNGAEQNNNPHFSDSDIIMSPHIRDPYPRIARRDFMSQENEGNNNVDRFLVNLGDSQDTLLKAAEFNVLDDIERKRAIIKATNTDLEDILSSSTFGKGGPTSHKHTDATLTSGEFLPRIDTVKARLNESQQLDAALKAMPLGHPIEDDHYQTSHYGMRSDPFTKRPSFHSGLDYASFKNARIVAAADGIVTMAGRNGGMGQMVEIDHGHGFKTRYGHMNRLNVKRGHKVSRGELIGGMGSTGRSTSTHLHYELYFQGRTVDPSRFIKAGQYVQ